MVYYVMGYDALEMNLFLKHRYQGLYRPQNE